MRGGWVVALASLLLLPSAAALAGGWQDLEEHSLDGIVAPLGEAASVNDLLRRGVQPGGRGGAPGSTDSGFTPSWSAGPAPPAELAAAAGADLLLWALAAGSLASTVGLGWRHLHRRNVLDHPARVAILALLRQQPGLHLRAVARATGQPVQRAAYHLDVLERLGLVASQELAGKRCYHEAGIGADVRRALLDAAMQPSPAARDVLAFVAANPGASQSEVARRLGMLPGRARWHLRRLAGQGALVEAREGKALTYRPRPPVSTGPRP